MTSQVPCKDYKKLVEIEERCLDCDSHLICFPMDEETKKFMGVTRQMGLEEAFA